MKIALIGLPGAGKGEQGRRLAQRLNCPHLSVGDYVRTLLKTDTPLAKTVRAHTQEDRWTPLPDELSARLALELVKGLRLDDYVLDGFPRNREQINLMPEGMLDLAIYLQADDAVCRERVLARGRSDDVAERFAQRMALEAQRMPDLVREIERKMPRLTIKANAGIAQVHTDIMSGLQGDFS